MKHRGGVGIYGIGTYLPDSVRGNDWWPEAIVEEWRTKLSQNVVRPRSADDEVQSEGVLRTLRAMAEVADDPFKGAVERRVMPDGMVSSDMELAAAREAIARAQVNPGEIDLILTYSRLPDYLNVPSAPLLHLKLGLPEKCISFGVEAACNSFMAQVTFAEPLIQSGQVRHALLIQSNGALHLCNRAEPQSAWFGDGATAVVMGRVSEGRGLLASAQRTDGTLYRSLVTGCPGGRWHSGERIQLYAEDRGSARKMLVMVADLGKLVLDEAMGDAGFVASDVRYYASHQATPWFRKVTQEHIGLENARSVDTFGWTASLGASNVPFMLAMGEREGLVSDGDLVAMYGGGSGVTFSGMLLRWGR